MSEIRRVLTIDGGGIRGAFAASFLAEMERNIDRPIGDYFDLIAGTSTGAIIALGLGAGMRAAEILALYRDLGSSVFGRPLWLNPLGLFRSKYDNTDLRTALSKAYGDIALSDAKARLVIPAYDVKGRRGVLMKTPHCDEYRIDGTRPLVQVALASAAAPTYFPIVRDSYGAELIDGGVFANNPSVVALAEAVFKLKWEPEKIHMLSISTTCTPEDYRPSSAGLGIIGWRRKAIDAFIESQSWMAHGTAKLALGSKLVRIEPTGLPHVALDDLSAFDRLVKNGIEQAQAKVSDVAHFTTSPAPAWRSSTAATVAVSATVA